MKSLPRQRVLTVLAAGTAALLSACVYDPSAYQQPYGQAYGYGGGYAAPAQPAPPPPQPAPADDGQYGYAPDDAGGYGYAYTPAQDDAYLPYVADSDVVLIGGDTFIWLVAADGHRYRRFYAHGDHRADVFQRRNQVRANGNGGWHGGGNPAWQGGNRDWGGAPATAVPRQPAPQGYSYRPTPQNQPYQQPAAQAGFSRPDNAPGARPGFTPNANAYNRNAAPRPRDEQHASPQVRPDSHGHSPYQP